MLLVGMPLHGPAPTNRVASPARRYRRKRKCTRRGPCAHGLQDVDEGGGETGVGVVFTAALGRFGWVGSSLADFESRSLFGRSFLYARTRHSVLHIFTSPFDRLVRRLRTEQELYNNKRAFDGQAKRRHPRLSNTAYHLLPTLTPPSRTLTSSPTSLGYSRSTSNPPHSSQPWPPHPTSSSPETCCHPHSTTSPNATPSTKAQSSSSSSP
jgi:hypothetical protein